MGVKRQTAERESVSEDYYKGQNPNSNQFRHTGNLLVHEAENPEGQLSGMA